VRRSTPGNIDEADNVWRIDVAPEVDSINEPVPDLKVLNRADFATDRNSTPGEIALLVDVSDATLVFDFGVKAQLHARVIYQRRELSPEGYRLHSTVTGASVLSPLAKPEATLTAEELFG